MIASMATKVSMSTMVSVCTDNNGGMMHCILIMVTMFLLQFVASKFTPRNVESYDYHCSLLDGPLKEHHSTT